MMMHNIILLVFVIDHRHQSIMLCYAAVSKQSTYYAQTFAIASMFYYSNKFALSL